MKDEVKVTVQEGQHLQMEAGPVEGLIGVKMVFRECRFEGSYDY